MGYNDSDNEDSIPETWNISLLVLIESLQFSLV
jgi:hypothetical protein